jgi:hypothetical protein
MKPPHTVLAVLMIAAATAARADEVTDWNAIAVAAMPTASPPVMSRVLAAMHGAMHDAVNSVEPRFRPYRFAVPANAGASKEAAAAAAAHGVLVAMVPPQKAVFDTALAGSLGKIAESGAKQDGVGVGRAVAQAMNAWRAADGFDAKASDKPGTAPGQWQRTPPGMVPGVLPQLGAVTPFVLKSARQFSAPGRPPLASAQFARDVKEIRAVGARTSTARTAEQTAAAIFWSGNEVPVWNAAARAASQARGLGLHDNARLFALLHMAGTDASIAAFEIKYTSNDWRPITAIRTGGGRADLAADPKWESLLVTPFHPEYPSGHCIVSGAAAQVLRDFFSSDDVKLDFVYPPGLGTVRSFTSFTQMAKEVEDARVWGGIHFRSTDEHSTELGRKIGGYAVASALRPL